MKKKFFNDVLLNMGAAVIPMFALQFIILPQVAKHIGPDSYGLLISTIAVINLFVSSFGSVLNNSRLIHEKKYKTLNLQGDFKIFLIVFLVINIILLTAGLYVLDYNLSLLNYILVFLTASLLLVTTYGSVEFRIKLNFKNIILSSIALFTGYFIGYWIFKITNQWIWIYIFGYGLNLIYIYKKTTILSEKISFTPIFKTTLNATLLLLGSAFMASIGTYIDKILIYPLLGGTAVSIYYVATILGKTISLAIGPLTGVLLSYLAQMKNFSNKKFKRLVLLSFVLGFISYWLVIIVSRPLLTIIYPQYIEEALVYLPVTTISIILTLISSAVNPVLMNFSHAKWQFFINVFYIIIYIPLSIYLVSIYGLMGLCYGIMIATALRLLSIIIIYLWLNRNLEL